MTRPPVPKLIGGPYKAPRYKAGNLLDDAIRGQVVVAGWAVGPIPWPYSREIGPPELVVTAELARAIRTESAIAICHHWGVGRDRVRRWRKALGVARFNAGTLALWRDLKPIRMPARGPGGARRPRPRKKGY